MMFFFFNSGRPDVSSSDLERGSYILASSKLEKLALARNKYHGKTEWQIRE